MVSKSDCLEWLKKRTPLEKTLLSFSSLLLLTLLLLVLVGIAFKGTKSDSSPDDEGRCWTEECIQIAADILSSMESEASTCSDFYGNACGKYGAQPGQAGSVAKQSTDAAYFMLKNLLDSPEKSEVSGFDDLKSFYSSCVRFGSYRPKVGATGSSLLDLMSKMGIKVWPIIDPLYDTSSFSLEHTLVSLILLDVPVVFRMEVIPDQQIDGSYLIKISPGGPHESGRSPSEIRSDVHLTTSVLTSLLLLGASAANTKYDVGDILSVDSSFAAIEQDQSTPCDLNPLAPEEAVSELNRLIPEINWAYILAEIRRSTGLLRSNFAVHLYCKHKIRDYVVHLNDVTIRSVTNYLGWRFFSKFVEHIIPTFEKSRFGREEPVPRWRVCLELMEKFASPLLTKAITTNVIGKEVQKEVENIANATLTTARQLVTRAKWLDAAQKSKVLKKVSRIQIRYPFYESKTAEATQHVNMSHVDVSNFTAAVINLERQWVIRKFKRLAQDDESLNGWAPLISPVGDTTVNDYTLSIYFDKIQSPYIRQHASQWMNFGGFGVSLARQITKVIMSLPMGTSLSDSLLLWNLWNQDISSMCFRKSSKHLLESSGKSLSPSMIEDFMPHIFLEQSALEIAYESARTSARPSMSLPGLNWSDQQMFFLAHAQSLCDVDASINSTHTIQRFNAALSTYRAFDEAFSCSSSSTHCQIWA